MVRDRVKYASDPPNVKSASILSSVRVRTKMERIYRIKKNVLPMEATKKNTMIVLIIVTIVSIGVIAVVYLDEEKEKDETMHFGVTDGVNEDEEHGCFFLIKAGKGVNIDP